MEEKQTAAPAAEKEITLTLLHVGTMLTILDREKHNADYYAQRIEDYEGEQYQRLLVESMHILSKSVQDEHVQKFVEKYPHLSWLFDLPKNS